MSELRYKELESELEDWRDGYRRVTEEGPRHDEKHCSCAVDLWQRNKELEAENKRLEFDKLNNTAEISNLKEELGMANRRIRKLAGDNR